MNESSQLKCIPINDGDFLPFINITQRLGRAEFQICPQYKRGKLVRVCIYPIQQEDCSYYYDWNGHGKRHFTIQAYQNLEEPKIWMHHYCKEHKSPSLRLYVPNGANFIWFTVYGESVNIGFVKTKH